VLDEYSSGDERGVFGNLSDGTLCTLVLVLIVVALFVLSGAQHESLSGNRNRFSGGMERPSLHLQCTAPEFDSTVSDELALQRTLYAGLPYVAVHLFSPSAGAMPADEEEGGISEAAQQDLPLYQFMQLAPGIDPGSFKAGGHRAPLLIPSIMERQMIYEPGYLVAADEPLTRQLLAAVWPIYRSPVLPERRPDDLSSARTRIYVETMTVTGGQGTERYVVIGHLSYRFPEALNNGSLVWLESLSSALTEIVYLGETWEDPLNRTNKRIDFLRENGYPVCADAYTDYAYPDESDAMTQAMHDKLIETGYYAGDIDQRAHEAAAQVRLSEALLDGRLEAHGNLLYPPFLAYPEAWAAYIAHCEAQQTEPPEWFKRLFMNRLGFNRLTIE
jgi:hypothetical protein